jgi:hypothetical protein
MPECDSCQAFCTPSPELAPSRWPVRQLATYRRIELTWGWEQELLWPTFPECSLM